MNLKNIVLLVVVAIGVIALVNWLRSPLREMTSTAQTQKAVAEQLVALIKQDYQMRRIDAQTYATANIDYLSSAAAYNGWAAYVISSMGSSLALDMRQYSARLADANKMGDAWIKWAKATHLNANPRVQSGSIPGVPDWVNIPDLFNKLMDLDAKQRQQFIADLNACMWRRFDDIPPAQ